MRVALAIVSVLLLVAASGMSPLAAQAPAAAPKAASPATVLNLNTATAALLEQLPGVGPRTAALIVEYRQKNGPFKKAEELMNVKGIGEKTFLRLKGRVTVTVPPPAPSLEVS